MRHFGVYRLMAMVFVFSWALFLPTLTGSWAADVVIDLIPDLDQIGSQIETVQVYRDGDGDRVMFGIYDTGASVISVSADDQLWFQLDLFGTTTKEVPTLYSGTASAQGIGGDLTGDVSKPGTILADGLHAFDFSFDITDIFDFDINYSGAIQVPNIQAFLGTATGSPSLPSITGTPIHSTGLAAKVDMQGYQIDFGYQEDVGKNLVIGIPDLHFVPHDTVLAGNPVRVPLQLIGENDFASDKVTSGPNPVQNNVALQGTNNVGGKTFLFDTGAQMSIISTQLAADLGLNLNSPDYTIDVQGAAGNTVPVKGFTLEKIELPLVDAANNPISDKLIINQAPVFVLDLGVEGLDGILGMNLWNTAEEMLYNPFDPDHAYVDMIFSDDPDRGLTQDQIDELSGLNPLLAYFNGALRDTSSLTMPSITPESIPEPSTWILILMGIAVLLFRRVTGRKP